MPSRGDELWEEFKVLLCKLYEIYGGDCADLDWGDEGDGEVVIAQVQALFDANGSPIFATPQEEQDYRDLLDDIEQNMGDGDNPISATTKAAAQSMINAMQAALPA